MKRIRIVHPERRWSPLLLCGIVEIEAFTDLIATVRAFLFTSNASMKDVAIPSIAPVTIDATFAIERNVDDDLLVLSRWWQKNEVRVSGMEILVHGHVGILGRHGSQAEEIDVGNGLVAFHVHRGAFALRGENHSVGAVDQLFGSARANAFLHRRIEHGSLAAHVDRTTARLAMVEDIAEVRIGHENIGHVRRAIRPEFTSIDHDIRGINQRTICETRWTTKQTFT